MEERPEKSSEGNEILEEVGVMGLRRVHPQLLTLKTEEGKGMDAIQSL